MGTSIDRFLQSAGGDESEKPKTDDLIRRRLEQIRARSAPKPKPEPEPIPLEPRLRTLAAVGSASPEQSRRVLAVQARSGLPTQLIDGDLEEAETEIWRARLDIGGVLRRSPTLAAWLAENEHHLAAAADDVDRLATIETQVREASSVREARSRRRYFRPADDDEFSKALVRGGATTVDLLAGALQTTEPENRFQAASQRILARIRGKATSVRESMGPARVERIGQVETFGDAIAYAAAKVGEGLPTTLPMIGGAIAGGPVGAGAVAFALARGEARSELEHLGVTDEAVLQRWSSLIAVPVALLDTAMPMSVVRAVIRDKARRGLTAAAERGLVRMVATKAAKSAGTEAATESAQGVITTVSAHRVAGVDPDWREVASQAFEEGMGGLLVGGLFGGASGAATAGEWQRSREASKNPELVTALGAAMRDSPLAREVPEKMSEILRRLSDGTPVETFYVPVESFDAYWTGKGADPATEAERILGDRRLYDEARAMGGDVAIPFEKYALNVAPTEHNEFFAQEVRLTADDMSAREASEAIARLATQEPAQRTAVRSEAAEILAAEPAVEPLFDDTRTLGKDAAGYGEAVRAANAAAEAALTERLTRQARREESAEWAELSQGVRAEVEAEIATDPVHRALGVLQQGELKLDDAALFATIGPELHEQLPRGVTGKAGEPGVVHPEVAAEMLGFRSARALADALAGAETREAAVERVTTQRMRERFGEQLTEEDVRDAALAAAYSEQRAELLRKELEFLAPGQAAAIPTNEALTAEAERIVGEKLVREISPRLAGLAARKQAKLAKEAFRRGDVEAAIEHRRTELLNIAILRASIRAKDAIDTALEDEFRDVFKQDATLAKTRDMDMVNAARAVLAAFGLGKSDKQASDYLEALKRYDPETFEDVEQMVSAATLAAKNYREVTYDDFAALRETVGSLWLLSRRSRQIEIDGELYERDQVEAELEVRLAALTKPGARVGSRKAPSRRDQSVRALMGIRAALRRVESWVSQMDGGDPKGAFRTYIWNPVSESASRYRLAKRSALEKYLAIVRSVEKSLTSEAIDAHELGYEFAGKAELLGAMLHTGNDSNLSKLLRGRGWGSLDERGNLDAARWTTFVDRMERAGVLTKTDYDYLQAVWDLFEELKPDAQRAHREMYGRYFDEITARSFSTPFGGYRGGYVPAKADPFLVPDAAVRSEQDVIRTGTPGTFPTTGRGFTKARVEEYAVPLTIDVRFVPMHIDAVLRFSHIGPAVRDVARVMISRDFKGTLEGFDATVRDDLLIPWLQRAAQQRVDTPTRGWGGKAVDTFFRELRSRTGLQIMAANVLNALQQTTGLSIAAVKVKPHYLAAALWRYTRQPSVVANAIAEKSDFMKTRSTASVIEIQKRVDNIMLDPSKYQELRDFTREHGYFLTAGAQNFVDVITWAGAYDQASAEGATEADAIRAADAAIRETQGSFSPEDMSRIEAGSPFVRAFTMFFSYFNMQANLLETEFTNTVRRLGLRKGAGPLLYIYTLGFMIPAVMSDVMWQLLKGENPFHDEDDDGPIDDILGLFFGSQVRTAVRFVPGAGAAAESMINQFTPQYYNNDIRTSPAIEAVGGSIRGTKAVYDAIKERELSEISKRDLRDILTGLGLLTGVPLAPLAKPVNYLRDVQSGRAEPEGRLDFLRGLVSGQPGGN